MQDIAEIKISTNAQGEQVVSARDLHAFLEVQTRFNDWIRIRIKEYDFIENQDYTLVTEKIVTNNPKNRSTFQTNYALTLDTAKELAIVEKTEKGRQARRYFIDCEKKLKQASALLDLSYEEYKQKYLAFCKTYATVSGFAFRLNRLIENELSDILALYEMGIKPEDMYLEYENLHTPKSDKGGDHEGGSPTAGKSAFQLQASPDYMTVKDYFLQRGVDLTPAKVSEANKICTRLSRAQQKMSGTFGHSVPTFCVEVLAEVFEQFSAKEGATHAK